MKNSTLLAVLATAFALLALPATAACFADYKAKQNNPLRLHYGTIRIEGDTCTKAAVAPEIARRIAVDGWILLNVLGVFDETGLAERKESAGAYNLRY